MSRGSMWKVFDEEWDNSILTQEYDPQTALEPPILKFMLFRGVSVAQIDQLSCFPPLVT